MKILNQWLEEMMEAHGELLTMDGYDDCIAGIVLKFGCEAVVVYDRAKVIASLMGQGMTWEEAEEFHEFNQAGAYVGERTPAFLIRPMEDEATSA